MGERKSSISRGMLLLGSLAEGLNGSYWENICQEMVLSGHGYLPNWRIGKGDLPEDRNEGIYTASVERPGISP